MPMCSYFPIQPSAVNSCYVLASYCVTGPCVLLGIVRNFFTYHISADSNTHDPR